MPTAFDLPVDDQGGSSFTPNFHDLVEFGHLHPYVFDAQRFWPAAFRCFRQLLAFRASRPRICSFSCVIPLFRRRTPKEYAGDCGHDDTSDTYYDGLAGPHALRHDPACWAATGAGPASSRGQCRALAIPAMSPCTIGTSVSVSNEGSATEANRFARRELPPTAALIHSDGCSFVVRTGAPSRKPAARTPNSRQGEGNLLGCSPSGFDPLSQLASGLTSANHKDECRQQANTMPSGNDRSFLLTMVFFLTSRRPAAAMLAGSASLPFRCQRSSLPLRSSGRLGLQRRKWTGRRDSRGNTARIFPLRAQLAKNEDATPWTRSKAVLPQNGSFATGLCSGHWRSGLPLLAVFLLAIDQVHQQADHKLKSTAPICAGRFPVPREDAGVRMMPGR